MNKVCLVILDGVGFSKKRKGNSIKFAKMPTYKKIVKNNTTLLKTNGKAVGFESDNLAGNSEAGHRTIGAGKIYENSYCLIDNTFKQNKFFNYKNWKLCVANGKKSAMHFIGLLSDGHNHGSIEHLKKMITQCKKEQVQNVYVHAILDGRDTPLQSGASFVKDIIDFLKKTDKNYKLIDFGGRNKIVMDRNESDTKMLLRGYELYVNKIGTYCADPLLTLNSIYKNKKKISDQDVGPHIIEKDIKINNGDTVVFYNFRGDRAVEFSQMFDEGKYINKKQFSQINNCKFFGMLDYDEELKIPKHFLIDKPEIDYTLTHYLVNKKIKQFSITESQKFSHITYYFNGNRKEKISKTLEDWQEVKSDVGLSFDKKPAMKAKEITQILCEKFKDNNYKFFKINYANGDMVGHTGNFKSAIKAMETVDECLNNLIKNAKDNNVILLITADHGNVENMINKDGSPNPTHTTNYVTFSVINNNKTKLKIKKGKFGLSNIANSVCVALGIKENKKFNESIIN